MRRIALGFAVGALSLTTGCASIVSGQNQSLSVATRNDAGPVTGAQCTLKNDKGTWYATTPGSVTVRRSFNDLMVDCAKDGQPPGTLSVKSSTKGMAFGNILFGGIIGGGVDMATGAAYDYPELITVLLSLNPPPVETKDPSTPDAPPAAAAPASAPVVAATQ